jgi:hypothetical protein
MSYSQEIYDAVRSRISGGDIGDAVRDVLWRQCDTSHLQQMIQQEANIVAGQMTRPAVLFKPRVYPDGDMWCALYGEDLQMGVAGFGESPDAAVIAFDAAWYAKSATQGTKEGE